MLFRSRYLASSGEDPYERLGVLDAEREAERFGIDAQHRIERACATDADVLTTVSPLTGEECTHLLGRTPDFVTPNGLDVARFDGMLGEEVMLDARWTLYGQNSREPLLNRMTLVTERTDGGGYDALVAASSRALELLSVEIAEAIKARR